jgi:hypothetical protein
MPANSTSHLMLERPDGVFRAGSKGAMSSTALDRLRRRSELPLSDPG